MAAIDERSYRALIAVPGLARVLVAMVAGRIASEMLRIATVLFALDEYSAAAAGAAAALSILPGLAAAPVIGALLDRWGRVRLIGLDFVVTAASLVVIGVLALGASLPSGLFLAIVAVFGLTYMFSDAGVRALLPRLAPSPLWERVNAADSTGYLLAWIVGPPIAAILITVVGGPVTFLLIAAAYMVAAAVLVGVGEVEAGVIGVRGVLSEALTGVRYAWRNRTIRGLGISVAVTNVTWGAALIVVPVVLVDRLSAPEPLVGIAFTVSGVVGVGSALIFGRVDTRGREWPMLLFAMVGVGLSATLLLPAVLTPSVGVGVAWVLASMAVLGFSGGLWDIAIFTLRQRRTDPSVMGRAFAISMAMNQTGVPAGAAFAGWMAATSLEATVLVGVCAGLLGAMLAGVLVPRSDDGSRYDEMRSASSRP
jgi:MFS family permease